MPQDLTDDKSTLVQAVAWCHQTTSHYPNQYRQGFMMQHGTTRPQQVNLTTEHSILTLKFGRGPNVFMPYYAKLRVSFVMINLLKHVIFFFPWCFKKRSLEVTKWLKKIDLYLVKSHKYVLYFNHFGVESCQIIKCKQIIFQIQLSLYLKYDLFCLQNSQVTY